MRICYKKPVRVKALGALVVVLALSAALLLMRSAAMDREGRVARRFPSPGQQYQVVVYAAPSLVPNITMPGQGSDGPGFVRLLDRSGRTLEQVPVDTTISAVDQVEWSRDSVHVRLLADWRLPSPDVSGR